MYGQNVRNKLPLAELLAKFYQEEDHARAARLLEDEVVDDDDETNELATIALLQRMVPRWCMHPFKAKSGWAGWLGWLGWAGWAGLGWAGLDDEMFPLQHSACWTLHSGIVGGQHSAVNHIAHNQLQAAEYNRLEVVRYSTAVVALLPSNR